MEIPLKFAWASLIYLLMGFLSMMIFGVGYHLLPVFAGTDLYSFRLAKIQFWL
jgi:cbb3-type cytochrome oxidase subunit 1